MRKDRRCGPRKSKQASKGIMSKEKNEAKTTTPNEKQEKKKKKSKNAKTEQKVHNGPRHSEENGTTESLKTAKPPAESSPTPSKRTKTISRRSTTAIAQEKQTKKFSCSHCKKTFSRKVHLELHINIHLGQHNYECDICKKTFVQKGNFLRHTVLHEDQRNVHCTVCKKTFQHESQLKKHMKTHSENRPYKCEDCDQSYYEMFELSRHKQRHRKQNKYICDQCRQVFYVRNDLVAHLKVHQPKKFQCNVCNKLFLRNDRLKKHQKRIHIKPDKLAIRADLFGKVNFPREIEPTKVKQFECAHCLKCFGRRGNLVRHLKIHESNKENVQA